ncbi:MAG: YdeI/OmpD-associated family protein [Acidobacteriota bacterium]
MADKQTFTAKLEKHSKLDATGIKIPFDVEKIYGAKRVLVKVGINGAEYRGSIVSMGGRYMLGIPKTFREAACVEAGDNIVVTIEQDVVERTVAVPKDLAAELKRNDLRDAWDSLSYTHRKEHVRAIEQAKQPETRLRRIDKVLVMLATKNR